MKHIELALSQVGIKEIIGLGDNPEILKYFDELGFDGSALKDETAWCSAFVNWVCKKSGLDYSEKLNARSWLDVGCDVDKDDEKVGDVVVFWRVSKSDWRGHVGFFISNRNGVIYTLGGNQGNQVCIRAYNENRLLQYRRLE